MDGLWLTDDHKGVVRIGACGGRTCGWMVRVLDRGPNVPTHDVNNPDPGLRGRAIVGMPILTGFAADGLLAAAPTIRDRAGPTARRWRQWQTAR